MEKTEKQTKRHRIKHLAFSYFGTHYIKYNIIGGAGVILNLAITFLLTEFLLGRQNYIYAFIIGNIFNIAYNYVTYIKYIFPAKGLTLQKKAFFVAYSMTIAFAQIVFSKVLVSFTGVDLYLPVLIIVIGALSIVSFFLFKSHLFNTDSRTAFDASHFLILLAADAILALMLVAFSA